MFYLKVNFKLYYKMINKRIFNEKIKLQNIEISIESWYNIKFLDKGKFGTVSLVHNKKNIFVIKAIPKASAEKENILVYQWKEDNVKFRVFFYCENGKKNEKSTF